MRWPSDGSPLVPTSDIPLMGDGSDQPAPDTDALNKLLPASRQGGQGAMFNAVLKMVQTGVNFLWYRYGAKINAQKSPLYADGEDLQAWGKYYKRPQIADEAEPDYRTRLLSPPAIITPAAITGAIKAQVSKVTNVQPVIMEPAVDAGFAAPASFSAGALNWSSFAQPSNRRLWAQDDSRPGQKYGAYVVPVVTSPLFWVLCPDVGDDSLAPHAMDVAGAQADPTIDFVNGSAYAWQAKAVMPNGLLNHSATRLRDGRILVAGGQTGFSNAPLASAYIFSPTTGAWSTVASMNSARARHGAVLLPTGQVLVIGGTTASGGTTYLASVEMYDPIQNTWTVLSNSLNTARHSFALVALLNGKLLVIGGAISGGETSGCELWNPATGAWSNTGAMSMARGYGGTPFPATLLRSGNVLVTGGDNLTSSTACEIYSTAAGTWSAAASMGTARVSHSAGYLPALNKVIVAGGWNGSGTSFASVEAYDEGANAWTPWPSMPNARYKFPLFVLGSGLVVCAGGYGPSSGVVDQFNPLMGSWTSLPAMSEKKGQPVGVLMLGDEPFVFGGDNGNATYSTAAERFSPSLTFWNSVPLQNSSLMDRIITEVQPRRAAGYPWLLMAEPLLGSDA